MLSTPESFIERALPTGGIGLGLALVVLVVVKGPRWWAEAGLVKARTQRMIAREIERQWQESDKRHAAEVAELKAEIATLKARIAELETGRSLPPGARDL